MGTTVLELEAVRKRYGAVEAVRGISLSVAPGGIYGVLGPNGAGKSTTLRMIVGILEPDAGRVTVLGGAARDHRDQIGYLPEERGLYRKMTAAETIAYFGRLKGLNARVARAEAKRLLELYGLGDAMNRNVEALSKGMAQKVQLLATIVHKPRLLILDEPFSGLDPVNQEILEELIRAQVRDGVTVLFSTHVMQHAERLCDRLIMIAQGSPVFDGTLAEARHKLPRRVHLTAAGDLQPLLQLPFMKSLTHVKGEEWVADLAFGGDPQALLGACFERGIALKRFDFGEPSLHEIFVALVGGQGESRMKKIYLIAAHEFRRTVITKGFWFQLLLFPFLLGVMTVVPRIMASASGESGGYYAVIDHTGVFGPEVTNAFDRRASQPPANAVGALPTRVPAPVELTREMPAADFGAAVQPFLTSAKLTTPEGQRRLTTAILIPRDYGEGAAAVHIWSAGPANTALMSELRGTLTRMLRAKAFTAQGVDPAVVTQIQSMTASVDVHSLGAPNAPNDAAGRFVQIVLPTMFGALMFMSVFSIGARLLSGVIEERSNRLVEMLLASVTSSQLMIGKLLGIGAVGLSVVLAWVASAMGMLNLSGGDAVSMVTQVVTPGLLAAFVIYFLVGYLIYASLFLAIGSISDSMQDAQSYMSPLVFISIVPMMMMAPISRAPNGTLATVMSWIPLYTPFTMMARMTSHPPLWEIIGTGISMTAFAVLLVWLLGRLFRVSLLASGGSKRLADLWRALASKGP